jgi:hypothetical protein
MRRTLLATALSLTGLVLGSGVSRADVIVNGPFGRRLVVVSSPAEVLVGPGVYVAPAPAVVPPQPWPPARVGDVAPLSPAPTPVGAIAPREFAKTFQPVPGTHEVTFLHPHSNQPVTVVFVLPAGQPRVSCIGNSLLFDYGQHEVEIRFKLGGKVVVNSR